VALPIPVVDPLTGAQVIVTPSRQGRPNLPHDQCPFCPGGLEAPEPYDVRWFVNRWPAMEGDRCEVVLYTPDHDASFSTLSPEAARRVVDLWAERTAALGARPDVAYVLVFENRGRDVGATIPHPHGQIYAFAQVPPVPARELAATCAVCREDPGERLVAADGGWRAWSPVAPAWPFAVVLAPIGHRSDLVALADSERDELGRLLVDVLGRLDRLFAAPMPYMLWIHQRPTDGGAWPNAHVHVEISPFYRAPGTPRYVAAGELGSGVYFNPVAPEEAAARLRAAG
jgi:UDPglucose--hexose-1-phosphate uridylyltransferase